MGALLLLLRVQTIPGEGSKHKHSLHNGAPTCASRQKVAWERFLIYSWLLINERVDFNTPATHASPRQDASCPAATSRRGGLSLPGGDGSRQPGSFAGKGSGSRRPSRWGGTQRGWGHAVGPRLSPATPCQRGGNPERMSVRLQPEGHRPLAPVAQPAHAPDVPAAKQNKQTTITALGFPRFDSLWFNFGNPALGCSQFAAGRKPAPGSARPAASCAEVLFPFLRNLGNAVLLKTIKLAAKIYGQAKQPAKSSGGEGDRRALGGRGCWGISPCTAGLRTWDGVSWISRVHSPAARSPQQWTVMNSQPLNPSLEWSNTLQQECRALRSVTLNVLLTRKR